MNSIFVPKEFAIPGGVSITGEYLKGLSERHQFTLGRRYALGLEGVGRAYGVLETVSDSVAQFSIAEAAEKLARARYSLVVGISRPQTVKKVMHVAASFGVCELVFIRSERAEKSYFQSAVLLPNAIRDELILGVEQGWDHELPAVRVEERFKPFVQDELSKRAHQKVIFSTRTVQAVVDTDYAAPVTIAVGPEAGWSDYEEQLFNAVGFTPISLGQRMLRVEVALAVGIGRLLGP